MLYLNTRPVTLPDGATFKYKIASPLFSSKGEFSLDVTVPLRGFPDNVALFGRPLYHPNVGIRYERDRGDFLLTAGSLHTAGTFEITASDETEVKIKLTAASRKFETLDHGKVYIDELPLGFFYQDEYDELLLDAKKCGYSGTTITPALIHTALNNIFDYETRDSAGSVQRPYENNTGLSAKYAYGIIPATNSDPYAFRNQQSTFCFPVTKDGSLVANDFYASALPGAYTPARRSVLFPDKTNPNRELYQIRLVALLRRVLAAVGLTLDDRNLTDFDRDHIVFTHIISTQIAQTLPHWTVEEFLTEVGNFLFCTYLIDPVSNKITPVRLVDVIDSEPQGIPVDSRYTTDVSKDENESGNTLAGTVDYDHKETLGNALYLPPSLFKEYGSVLPPDGAYPEEINYNTLYQDPATGYGTIGDRTNTRLNLFAPLIRNSNYEPETRLRIIPAGSWILTRTATDPLIYTGGNSYQIRIPTLTIAEKPVKYQAVPLSRVIEDTTDQPTRKPDYLHVANLLRGSVCHYKTLTPSGRLYQPFPVGRNIAPEKKLIASNNSPLVTPLPTLLQQTYANDNANPQTYEINSGCTPYALPAAAPSYYATHTAPYQSPYTLTHLFRRLNHNYSHLQKLIDTRTTYNVTLYPPAARRIDPLRPLLFAGNRYAIKQLEYTITPTAARPAIHATLYRIN